VTEPTSDQDYQPIEIAEHKRHLVRLAALSHVKGIVENEFKDAKAEAAKKGYVDPGDTVHAVLPGYGDLGTVYRTQDGSAAYVSNDRVLLEWVKKNHPGEIVETIRPTYLAALLEQATAAGAALVINPETKKPTGETIPGIDIKPTSGYVAVKQSAEQKQALADAWQAGVLSERGQIEPPEVIELHTAGSPDPVATESETARYTYDFRDPKPS
jgi:hypothetical protein